MAQLITSSELIQYYVTSPTHVLGDVHELFFNEWEWKVVAFGVTSGQGLIKRHLALPMSSVHWIDISSRRILLWEDPRELADLSHLHSTRDLSNLKARTPEKPIGKVKDLLFDRNKWEIKGLVLALHHFLQEKRVLIKTESIQKFDWKRSEFEVSLHEAELKLAPEYHDELEPVSPRELFG